MSTNQLLFFLAGDEEYLKSLSHILPKSLQALQLENFR
jgi:hypothetical protein